MAGTQPAARGLQTLPALPACFLVPPTSAALLPALRPCDDVLLSWRRTQAAPAPIKPAGKKKSAPQKRKRDDDDDDDDDEACTPLEAAAAKYDKLTIKKLKVLPIYHSQQLLPP